VGDGSGTALWFSAPELEILAVRDDGHELVVEVETPTGPVGCPGCGVRARAKDRRWVTLRDAPTAERSVLVRWRKRVFCCPDRDCRVRTWTEQASLAEPRRVLTARAARWATDQVAAIEATPASIARRFGVSWSTVWAAIARETAGRVTAPGEAAPPSMLGFDESVMVSARRRRRRQLVTAVVDVATGRTIDVFEGRDAADLRAWLTCMPAGVARRGPGGVGRPTRGLPVSGGAPRPAHRTGEPPRRRHRGGRSVPHRAGAPRCAMCSEAGERSASPGCRSSLVKLRAA